MEILEDLWFSIFRNLKKDFFRVKRKKREKKLRRNREKGI